MRSRPTAIAVTLVVIAGAALGALAVYTGVETRRAERAFPPYAELALPATIVVGDRDRGIAESRALATALPCAELVVVPATGHELPLTRAALVATAVRRVAEQAACARGEARRSP